MPLDQTAYPSIYPLGYREACCRLGLGQAGPVQLSLPAQVVFIRGQLHHSTIGSRGDCTHPPTLLSIQLSVLPLQDLTNLVSCVLVKDMLIRVRPKVIIW